VDIAHTYDLLQMDFSEPNYTPSPPDSHRRE